MEPQEYKPLHLKYRPTVLKEMVGNRTAIKALKAVLDKPTRPHAFLFTGPSGCGKTTLARIVANELGCIGMDFQEMNSANYRGIEAMRELVAGSVRRPWNGDVKVYLLDECHQITPDGQHALLKLLEEPPKHTYFMLATTDPEKLRATIKSRCMSFPVETLRRSIVKEHLEWVCGEEEKIEEYFDVEDSILSEISRLCGGSMRQALIMLDQVSDLKADDAIEALAEFVGGDHNVRELCRALSQGNIKWVFVQELLKGIKADGETIRLSVLGYFETIMLNEKDVSSYVEVVRRFTEPGMVYTSRAGITLACHDVLQTKRQHGV